MKTPGRNKLIARLFKKEGVRGLFAAILAAAILVSATSARAADLYPGNGAAISSESSDLPLPGTAALISTPTWPAGYIGTGGLTFNWAGPSTVAVAGLSAGSYFRLQVSSGDAAFGAGNFVISLSVPAIINPDMSTIDGAYTSGAALTDRTTYYWRVITVDGVLLSSGPWSQVYSFVTDYSSPAASGFAVRDSVGGALNEGQFVTLASGVTVQITVQDLMSGLAVSTSSLWGGSDGHDWGDLTGGFSVKYTTNSGNNWLEGAGWGDSNGGSPVISGASAVQSLAVYNGKLYAGTSPDCKVSVFDGTVWSASNGGNSVIANGTIVKSLAVYNGKLYAGTIPEGKVVVFDGTTWSVANGGAMLIPGELEVRALAVYNGKLYAGTGGGGKVAVFDGTAWSVANGGSPVMAGEMPVDALTVYNGKLYVGAGSNGKVGVFDGTTWSLANGGNQILAGETSVWRLTVYNGKLYGGTIPGGKVVVFDGTTWSATNSGNAVIAGATHIYSLAVHNGRLYAGTFPSGRVAVFDGTTWSAANGGGSVIAGATYVQSLAAYNGKLYAGTIPTGNVAVMSPFNATLTGADGTNMTETLSASLDFARSTNTATCNGIAPCGATNQVLFTASDMAGNVHTVGPYAVLVDTLPLPAGCGVGANVGKNGTAPFDSIQAAINSLPVSLSTTTCVVIRDTSTYSEQVTIQGFNTSGYRLKIMADPTFTSSAPIVNPPVSSTAAFQIMNASVTVQGINIISTNPVSYGILSSSASVNISSVNVISGENIWTAGISLSSWSVLSNSSITVQNAYGLYLAGSLGTSISYTTATANSASKYALYLNNASSNSFTQGFISNSGGSGVSILNSVSSDVSQSTVTCYQTCVMFDTGASSNSVTQSYVLSTYGRGVTFGNSASYNTVRLSTIVYTGYSGQGVWFMSGPVYNTVTQSVISSQDGYGAYFSDSSRFNTISDSRISNNSSSFASVMYGGAAEYSNTVTRSYITNNAAGSAVVVRFNPGVKWNTVSYSTITTGGTCGLYFNASSSNTVTDSYVRGYRGVCISGSTGTVINSSVLVANSSMGDALRLEGGSVNLSMSSNTVIGGGSGASGINLLDYNSGAIELSSNTITGGQYCLNIATQSAGATLSITSMTFSPQMAGATAINFLGGTFVSTFTGVSFNSSNIAVNVDASRLEPASRITMLSYFGRKVGTPYEIDPNGLVDWPCQLLTSENTGDWSNPAIWSQGYVPLACSPVKIVAGHTVTLDIMNAVSSGTIIKGTLMASRSVSSSWTLTAGDINVSEGGTLDYGNEADPIPTDFTAHLVLSSGSYAGQYGLIVNNGGNFTVRGSTKTPYAFATESMTAAQTNLTVYGSTSTYGWQAGDIITIGPTSGNGVLTTSSRTLLYVDHTEGSNLVGWSGAEPLGVARILAEGPILVSNLTRNVLVRSSGTDVGANSAYIQNLAQNTTSFSLSNGEFAYLGADIDGKYGITFNGALVKGFVSSSTVRNGYRGIYLNASSTITLAGNNFRSNSGGAIWLLGSSNNTLTGNSVSNSYSIILDGSSRNMLTGNNSCSNSYGISLYSSPNNTLAGNNFYSNYYGIDVQGSSSNTLTGNNLYSNTFGIFLLGSNNTLARNNFYANADRGIHLSGSDNNAFTGNNIYSNPIGIYSYNSSGNIFADGRIGYNAAGAGSNNTSAEIYFETGSPVNNLALKGTRMNPAVGISTEGMNMPGASIISYNQDADTGTVRIWGNYRVAGSTLALDYASPLYRASNTAPKLMRGAGHSASVTDVSDTYAVSQLITITYRSGLWHVDGSSSGADMISFVGNITDLNVPLTNSQFKLSFTQGETPQDGDTVDFVLTGWSKDSGYQKKLLFGYSAAGYNGGRSKLEVADNAGVVLKGNPDGTANTLIDMIAGNSTYYTFVDSGAFTVEYASFTNMDPGGIQLSGSGGVAISSSTFDYLGFASGTNAYITARSLTSNATLDNITFGLSRSSAGFDSAYNVRVEGAPDNLNWSLINPSGYLWGER